MTLYVSPDVYERLRHMQIDYSMLADWCRAHVNEGTEKKQREFGITAAIMAFFLEHAQITQPLSRDGNTAISLPLPEIIERIKQKGIIPVEAGEDEYILLIKDSLNCLRNCWDTHIPK